jgi:hypothetical protein
MPGSRPVAVSEVEAEEMRLATTLNTNSAPLPAKYEAAKAALAECASVDECSSWAKKAAAMASYARQAEDKSLEYFATRIRARAIRRCGELLASIPAKAYGGGANKQGGDPVPHLASARAQVAKAAGLSRDQTKDALRVAKIPAAEFAADVDDDTKVPPTIEDLVERGTAKKPKPWLDLQGRNREDYHRAIHTLGPINELARLLEDRTRAPAVIVRGMLPFQRDESIDSALFLVRWLGEFAAKAREVK